MGAQRCAPRTDIEPLASRIPTLRILLTESRVWLFGSCTPNWGEEGRAGRREEGEGGR